jgi:hypothetical protein
VIRIVFRSYVSKLRAAVPLKRNTVTYEDGSIQEVNNIDAVMSPGQFSKTIVLPGASKRISRVEYKFGPGTGGSGKGMMRLYGYKVVKP